MSIPNPMESHICPKPADSSTSTDKYVKFSAIIAKKNWSKTLCQSCKLGFSVLLYLELWPSLNQ